MPRSTLARPATLHRQRRLRRPRAAGASSLLVTALLVALAPMVPRAAATEPVMPAVPAIRLPDVDGGIESAATGLDGDVVVGRATVVEAGTHAVAWDLASRPVVVTDLDPGFGYSVAVAVSGRLVVGWAVTREDGPVLPVVWDLAAPAGVPHELGTESDVVTAVSGTVAVGSVAEAGAFHAVAWDCSNPANPRRMDLDPARRFDYSAASAIDGRLAVGVVLHGPVYRAAAWHLGGSVPELELLETADADSAAYGVSGTLAVGYVDGAGGWRAAAWDVARPRVPPARSLDAQAGSEALAVDGDLVAGTVGDGAVAWDLAASGPVVHPLASLGGDPATPAAVSDRLVAGTAADERLAEHAVVWYIEPSGIAADARREATPAEALLARLP